MKKKLQAKKLFAGIFLVLAGGVFLLAGLVTWSFFFDATEYLLNYGLMDPAQGGINPAGLYFGRSISLLFLVGVAGTIILCVLAVVTQLKAFETACNKWDEEGKRLQSGSTSTDEVVQELATVVPENTRIRAALDSWLDASPDSDPEYVIEGEAVYHRQWLGILQTLASVLVLIGLVGNFFGLADAVKTLPELPGAMVSAEPAPPAAQRFQQEEVGKSGLRRVTGQPSSEEKKAAPTTDRLKEEVSKISEGLQVVVISSIMGIGGMALLLMLVSLLRGLINATIADEVVLLSAEIGTVLRPPGAGGFSEELKQGLAALPERLASFDQSASKVTDTLGRYGADFGEVSKNLDKLLEHQLVDTQTAYQQYHKTLEEFTKVLVDQQGSVTQLTDTTKRLCDNLEGISKSVKSVADQSANVGDRLNEIQLQYETYLKAATEDIENTRNVVTKLHEKIIADADERMATQSDELKSALERITQSLSSQTARELESLVERLVDDLGKHTIERHQEMLGQLSSLSQDQLKQYEAQLERMESLIASQETLHLAAQRTMDKESSLGETLAQAAESLKDARQALTDNRNKLIQFYDDLIHKQEIALRELVESWKTSLESPSRPDDSIPQALGLVNQQLGGMASGMQNLVNSLQSLKENASKGAAAEKAPDTTLEEALRPLVSETSRLVETLARMESVVPASNGPAPVIVSKPTIDNPKCQHCGRVNKSGAVQCSDCGNRLSSGGMETLNDLVHQLIEAIDRHPASAPALHSEDLIREVQIQRDLLTTNQERLIAFLSDMPLNMKQALSPEIVHVSEAVQGLSSKLDGVADGLNRLGQKRQNRKRETQTLDDPAERSSEEESSPSTPVSTDAPAEETDPAPDVQAKVPIWRRDIRTFLWRNK